MILDLFIEQRTLPNKHQRSGNEHDLNCEGACHLLA